MRTEKENWLNHLAANLKLLRKKLGLSQQALAEKSRLSINTVAKIEITAVENPTLETIESLGQALELNDSLEL